jgi:hypothetical protein
MATLEIIELRHELAHFHPMDIVMASLRLVDK